MAGGNPRTALGVGLPVAWLTIGACVRPAAPAPGWPARWRWRRCTATANASLIAGYGYSGILIAFAARFSPAGVVPVAILVGGIAASGSLLQRRLGLPDAAVTVLLGFAFVALIGCETLRGAQVLPARARPGWARHSVGGACRWPSSAAPSASARRCCGSAWARR
ncbi:MAG: hypothetical protein U5M50_00020 [Sphingobium sp.]|nr:hypothetical protein [Sphingobium sp.]